MPYSVRKRRRVAVPQQTPASATADPGERERGSRHMVPSVSKRDLCRRYCPVPAVAAWSKFVTGLGGRTAGERLLASRLYSMLCCFAAYLANLMH